MKDLNKNKAPGIDELPAELIENSGDVAIEPLHLVCKIYETGDVPLDFKKSVIVMIPKKAGTDKCEEYRTISLVGHASKILTRIIYRRQLKNNWKKTSRGTNSAVSEVDNRK